MSSEYQPPDHYQEYIASKSKQAPHLRAVDVYRFTGRKGQITPKYRVLLRSVTKQMGKNADEKNFTLQEFIQATQEMDRIYPYKTRGDNSPV